MKTFKIGVMSGCFQLGLEGGIRKAAAIGAQGVQLYAADETFSPWSFDAAKRRDLRALLAAEGLEISALCAELGGFAKREDLERKLDITGQILDFAPEMGTRVVTAHIGRVSDLPGDEATANIREALLVIGERARRAGVTYAIETGPEPAAVLRRFIDSLGVGGIGINFDPANLTMCSCDDAVAAVETLAPYIVHTHAKDGRNLRSEAEAKATGLDMYLETPLGEGDVDFPGWLAALERIGYDGYLTIERECGDKPEKDITMALTYLKSLMK